LERPPDDWDLGQYSSHAWRLTRAVWLAFTAASVLIGVITGEPFPQFGEGDQNTGYTTLLLAVCSVVAAQCASRSAASGRPGWRLIAVGFFFLAADDFLQLHEYLAVWIVRDLGWPAEEAAAGLFETLLLVLYALIGVALVFAYRRSLLQIRSFEFGLAKAGAPFAVMVVLNLIALLFPSRLGPQGLVGVLILAACFKGLAASRFVWLLLFTRFQIRRAARTRSVESVADAVRDGS
jgi:hypothetical protein